MFIINAKEMNYLYQETNYGKSIDKFEKVQGEK